MSDPHTDLAPIIGPSPSPVAAATAPMPWAAGLAALVLAVVLASLVLRLGVTRRRLARLQRAAVAEDPRSVAGRLAQVVAHRHKLPYLSVALCPVGIDAAAWAAWVEALDTLRFGTSPGNRAQLARLCRDAKCFSRRTRKC